MEAVAMKAVPAIGRWHHVCDRDTDHTGWWGAFGDGHIGNSRLQLHAHQNVCIRDISHSRLLSDPAAFPLWKDHGLIDFLHAGASPARTDTGTGDPPAA